ncbi:M91 family zinc metallopeptidase [Dyella sp. 2RAB6]|uniref:M91 family zinc metallopeptidase n=1 Tax=Dyella sp. 2RAB6 TaxID=3232992 RepID=UPI003F92FD94
MPKDSLRTRVVEKFAAANRTGVAPKMTAREQRIVDKVSSKLAKAVATGKPADIGKRWQPVVSRVARTPAAGITAQMLEARKAKLKPVEQVHVHRELSNVHVKRTDGESAAAFTDLAVDARRSMHTLMSQKGGHQMMKEVDARVTQNRQHAGDNAAVYIRSTKSSDTSNMNAPHPVLPGVKEGYRFDGKAGKGWGSEVRINPNEARSDRFIGLGHEMVHAHRLAHGRAVSVPQLSQPDHPLFKDPISVGAQTEKNMNEKLGQRLLTLVHRTTLLQEEFETVGLSKPPGGGFHPTENMLRAEHGLKARADYSKAKPGHTDKDIKEFDELFDNRSGIKKAWHDLTGGSPAPTPLSDMVKRYKS